MHTIKDIHKDYLKHVEDPIETRLFKQLCEEFNMQVINLILEGKEFSMGNNLSTLSVRRIERNPSKPTIDWWETTSTNRNCVRKVSSSMMQNQGEVRSGLSTTLIPGTVNITGRNLGVKYLTNLLIGLHLQEV